MSTAKNNPIVCKEWVTTGPKECTVERTYAELLEVFDDEHNLVRPLVLRCQEYERTLAELVDAGRDWIQSLNCVPQGSTPAHKLVALIEAELM